MSLVVSLDISKLLDQVKDLAGLGERLEEEIHKLTVETYTHIATEASSRFKSRRDIYLNNLKEPDQLDPHNWKIDLDKPAWFIEDGIPAGYDMLKGFLKGGKEYLVIPFKHNKAPTRQTPVQKFLATAIKADLAQKNIPYRDLETKASGSAKLGLLHKMNIDVNMSKAPKKDGKPWAPSEGSGPLLHNVNIRQNPIPTTKAGAGAGVQKDIMTFRTASKSQQGKKWLHPGLAPAKLFDEAAKYASDEWDNTILPKLLKEFGLG